MLKRMGVQTSLVVLACTASFAAYAYADSARRVDIPAGDLVAALEALTQQSGAEVIYKAEQLKSFRTHGVVGTLTSQQAITALLEGTPFVVKTDSSGAMLIALPRHPVSDKDSAAPTRQPDSTDKPSASGSAPAPAAAASSGKLSSRTRLALATDNDAAGATAAASKSDGFSIEEVVVNAKRYGAQITTVGRLAVPYIDTPAAASVVTSQLLKDANLFSSDKALKYVPSIKNYSQSSGTQKIRGLSTSSSYMDGFRNAGSQSFDTFFADRIEVAKGPSSVSFGRGDPAGFVNYVSKRPEFKERTQTGLLVGTGNDDQNTYRVTLDRNGYVTSDQQTAYRLVAFYGAGAETMDYSDYKRTGAQLAIARDLSDKGRVDVIASFMKYTSPGAFQGSSGSDQHYYDFYAWNIKQTSGLDLASFPLFDGDFVLGHDGMGFDQNNFRLTGILDYELSDHWRTRQAVSYLSYANDGLWLSSQPNTFFRSANGTLMAHDQLRNQYIRNTTRSWQSDFLGTYDFDSIGTRLSLLTGADINEVDSATGNTLTADSPQPVYTWDPGHKTGPFIANVREVALVSSGRDYSAYVQGQLGFFNDRVRLTAAARRIWQDTETFNRGNGVTTTNKRHGPILPTYSILVKPLAWLSIFGTHSEQIEPATVIFEYPGLPAVFPVNDPRRTATITQQPATKQDEFGVKASVFDNRLTLSASHYKLKNSGSELRIGIFEPTPGGGAGFVTYNRSFLSNASVEGWELEGFGQVGERLSFMFGGTFGAKSSQIGVFNNTLISAPLEGVGDSAYGYATYSFGPSRYDGLSLTAGWKSYFSGWSIAFTAVPDKGISTYPDDEHTFDLGVSYGINGRYELFLKADNLFHKEAMPLAVQSAISGRQIFGGINASW